MIFDQPVFDLLKSYYSDYDTLQKKWLSNHVKKISCKPGCIHCCNMSVKISLAEALLIDQSITKETRSLMIARGEKHLDFAESWKGDDDAYFLNFRKNLNKCPLLSPEGNCIIYPVRPFSCRSLVSVLKSDFCRFNVIGCVAEGHLKNEVDKLDSRIFEGTPYCMPLFKIAGTFESEIKRGMKKKLGFYASGELNFMIFLLNSEKIKLISRKNLKVCLESHQFSNRMFDME